MSAMDSANLAAAWVSAAVTAIGLGSLMTQTATIRDQLDPFHSTRGEDHLGGWSKLQRVPRWYGLTKPPPIGPVIEANLHGCLGGTDVVYLSRKPMYGPGKATWTVLLAVFHPAPIKVTDWHLPEEISTDEAKKSISIKEGAIPSRSSSASQFGPPPNLGQWYGRLVTKPLIHHKKAACTTMSRMTLVTFLLLSQAREIYRYNSASGLRMAYASYNGLYQIEWPLAERPIISFEAHESHPRGSDCYPETFPRRPKKCVEMCVGVIDIPERDMKIAFAGRKAPGRYVLEWLRKRFAAQRSAADLYNKIGGQAHEVDYLSRRRLAEYAPESTYILRLTVPSLEEDKFATLYLGRNEVDLIAACLDHIPWSPLAWSIHRGLKDVLVAYGKHTMKVYQSALASAFRTAVKTKSFTLISQGWQPDFVRSYMADQAASAILGGETCSGDACRIVSAVTLLFWNHKSEEAMDKTTFWREQLTVPRTNTGVPFEEQEDIKETDLTPDAIVALVKLFFVMWSLDFDYESYHDLPAQLIIV
ncbi:MAG: hypothetical protein M1827_004985 [Pycnora praestabilis]|nr:MAG: hypothetical protein M1827_004985 [Pycnora praestabilis]